MPGTTWGSIISKTSAASFPAIRIFSISLGDLMIMLMEGEFTVVGSRFKVQVVWLCILYLK